MDRSTPKEIRPWWVSADRIGINYYITGASIYIVRTRHEVSILSSLESGERHSPYNLHRETNSFIKAIVEGLTQYYRKIQAV